MLTVINIGKGYWDKLMMREHQLLKIRFTLTAVPDFLPSRYEK
jgi:hypothetical protein